MMPAVKGGLAEVPPEALLSAEMLMARAITDLVSSHMELSGDDSAFFLSVYTVNSFYYNMAYCEHDHGALVLMDDTTLPPRPKIIAMRHIVEVSIDADCTTARNHRETKNDD